MLTLGSGGDGGADVVGLPAEALLGKVLVLGSSGAGKTVFSKVVIEELARAGTPVVAIDLRGDLASLARFGDEVELVRRGADKEAARAFHERAEVVVFTPGSRRGIPLSLESSEASAPLTGSRRLLFTEGVPIDAATLLGEGVHARPGRTRISVVYLGALQSQDDRALVVSTIADRLRRYARRNPSSTPKALFHIDEVAPFAPEVAEPECKAALGLLLDEAPEHGLACSMATGHPQDVDYDVLGRPATFALGFTSPTDLPKVEAPIRAHAPADFDAITERITRLGPGELLLLSPEHFDAPKVLKLRWLYSDHCTVDEEGIAELVSDGLRERFAPLMRVESGNDDPTRSVVGAPHRPEAPTPVPPPPEEPADFGGDPAADFSASEPTLLMSDEGAVDRRDDPTVAMVLILAEGEPLTVKEFAERTKMPVRKARRALKGLLESGDVRRYKDGRSYRYWATATGGRPDLGLPDKVVTVAATLGAEEAEKLGEEIAANAEGVTFEAAELVHRLLYRATLDGGGRVYLHASRLEPLAVSEERGISFSSAPDGGAGASDGLDAVAAFVDVPPGTLVLWEADWEDRAAEEDARERAAELSGAEVPSVTPVFVPVWRLTMTSRGGKKTHHVLIDAVVGRPIEWP